MQDKELHKLGKTDLLAIIYEQQKNIEKLKNNIIELEKQLNEKSKKIKEENSIEEAILKINKIFEVTQRTDKYLNGLKKVNKLEFQENMHNITNEEKHSDTNINKDKIENIIDKKNQKINRKNKKQNTKEESQTIKEETSNMMLIPVNIGLASIATKFSGKIRFYLKKLLKKCFNNILRLWQSIKKIIKKIVKKQQNKKNDNETKKQQTNKNDNETKKQVLNTEITLEAINQELSIRRKKETNVKFTMTFIFASVVVIAIAIIVATSFFKVLQVNGSSMEPNLQEGELLITSKFFKYKKGDMVAFYYNDKILIKRVIAIEGDVLSMEDDGSVTVNGTRLQEDYVKELDYGKCDITFPFMVPENSVFILGDNRKFSLDSRSSSIGCILNDNIIGKIKFRLKPFTVY